MRSFILGLIAALGASFAAINGGAAFQAKGEGAISRVSRREGQGKGRRHGER